MKWKQITITIIACFLMLAVGTIGFSFLYQIFFDSVTVFEDSKKTPTEWQAEQEQYERVILYPCDTWLASEVLAETDEKWLFSDFYDISPEAYSSVNALSGLIDLDNVSLDNSVLSVYDFKTDTTEYREYGLRQLLYITQIPNLNGELFVVTGKNDMPVLCQYRTESGSSNGSITSQASVKSDELPSGLNDYLAHMDMVLGENSLYRLFIRNIENQLHSIDVEHLPGSFAENSKYGEWRIYSDADTQAYVCILQNYNFIVYYNILTDSFSGYSIALNHIE